MQPLSGPMLDAVLAYLAVTPAASDLALLNQLLLHYGQTVPWESASRIIKRARIDDTAQAPRWSEEFWKDAIHRGTGGTCFESNAAFLSLLTGLGYAGYLTINNMGATIGCHTAIVVHLDGEAYLVDAGYPIYGAVPLNPSDITHCTTPYLTYTAEPVDAGRYVITNQPHPKPYLFDLIDAPVDTMTYQAAATNDYGPEGLFLDRVIVRKVIDDAIWRFDSASSTPQLERFQNGEQIIIPIEGDVAGAISRHFGTDESVVRAALACLGSHGLHNELSSP